MLSPPGTGLADRRISNCLTSTQLTSYYGLSVPTSSPNYHAGGWTIPKNTDVKLDATQYVAGDFTQDKGSTLDLNGHTLFVDGKVWIQNTTVNYLTNTSGCIVATKNVTFMPNQNTGNPSHGVFILSLGSTGAEIFRAASSMAGLRRKTGCS